MSIRATAMESNMEVPQKLTLQLQHNPVIPLIDKYPKECTPRYDRTTCTPMFTEALFTIAKLWKQTKSPQLINGLRKCGI
jgi:hypothetical protein